MRKFLIIQLLLFYCFISFSQEAVNYKVKFTYDITGDKPCDDVSNKNILTSQPSLSRRANYMIIFI